MPDISKDIGAGVNQIGVPEGIIRLPGCLASAFGAAQHNPCDTTGEQSHEEYEDVNHRSLLCVSYVLC